MASRISLEKKTARITDAKTSSFFAWLNGTNSLKDPGKAAWARQRLRASDFARLRLDGSAWRRQILQGTNQTSLHVSRAWLLDARFVPVC